jgi:hypothetical protein
MSPASPVCLGLRLAGVVATSSAARIAKVYDQYNHFVSLESGLFSLGLPNVYVELNDPRAQDMQIEVRAVRLCTFWL